MFNGAVPPYFCGVPFTSRQVGKKLSWLLASGDIRQLVNDVYVAAQIADTAELRAAAIALLIPDDATACGRTAAWIHGIETTALGAALRARSGSSTGFASTPEVHLSLQWVREPRDVVTIAGLSVTSPVATAVELAMQLPRPFALSAVDAMLRSGIVDRWAIRAASAAYAGQPGIYQARQILHYADRRAGSPGESWLRLRLIDAGFGLPELQIRVRGQERHYLIDLGYPDQLEDGRRLGLEYDSDRWHSRPDDEERDEVRRTELEALGWHIISVKRSDLWGSYPALELAVGGFLCVQPRLPRRW